MNAKKRRLAMAWVLAVASVCAQAASAADDQIESRQVQFAKGTSSAVVKGSIKGYQTIDYTLRARAGQTMSVKLKTSHPSSYFNVLPPGSNDVALFVGSRDGNEWTGTLPADGEYKLRVYLMRNAARRNAVANYTLNVGITGSAQTSLSAAPASNAQSVIKGRTQGHCTLTNVAYGRDIYNSTCTIKEKIEGSNILYKIVLGTAEPFMFASVDGGQSWMHGPEDVRFSDYGHSGTFRWGDFRLQVEEY